MALSLAVVGLAMASLGQTQSVRISQRVGEEGQPPRLVTTLHNAGKAPLSLSRFKTAACFASHELKVSLVSPSGKVDAAPACAEKADPPAKAALAPDAEDRRELDLRELFPKEAWAPGRYALSVTWIKHAAPGPALPTRALEFTLAKALAHVKIKRGETVRLPDGAELTFSSHSHKRTMVGDVSPLIIYGAFAAQPGKPAAEFQVNHFAGEDRSFELDGGHSFLLVDHEYDGWMELVYFGRLAAP